MNSVRPSSPPKQQLEVASGSSIRPRRVPSAAKQWMPSAALLQTRPASSTRKSTDTSGSRSPRAGRRPARSRDRRWRTRSRRPGAFRHPAVSSPSPTGRSRRGVPSRTRASSSSAHVRGRRDEGQSGEQGANGILSDPLACPVSGMISTLFGRWHYYRYRNDPLLRSTAIVNRDGGHDRRRERRRSAPNRSGRHVPCRLVVQPSAPFRPEPRPCPFA